MYRKLIQELNRFKELVPWKYSKFIRILIKIVKSPPCFNTYNGFNHT